jgi:hypothetical protein
LAERLAEEEADVLGPDSRVLRFRAEILRRWPELADVGFPWHQDLDWRRPWGRTDPADRFVGLTLPYGWTHIAELPALDRVHGLDCYDPQGDEVLCGRLQPGLDWQTVHGIASEQRRVEDHGVGAGIEVSGWVGGQRC